MNAVASRTIGGRRMISSQGEVDQERTYRGVLQAWMEENDITPMDLVRYCAIGVSTAYKASRNDPTVTLDTLVRIYNKLRRNGFEIKEADVYEIIDPDQNKPV